MGRSEPVTVPYWPRRAWSDAIARLLLIEDDEETAGDVAGYFGAHGYAVERAATGPDGLAAACARPADVIVLDRLLPGLNGLTVVEALRRAGLRTPVLMLSALDGVDEKVRGLRAGGDDYLGKPFALAELEARVEALLRRPARDGAGTLLRAGPLELDLVARTARRGGRALDLLPREFTLLEYLVRHPGQVVTRAKLLEDAWGLHGPARSNLVDVHMGRLRRKLDGPGEPELVASVRGVGFVLGAPA